MKGVNHTQQVIGVARAVNADKVEKWLVGTRKRDDFEKIQKTKKRLKPGRPRLIKLNNNNLTRKKIRNSKESNVLVPVQNQMKKGYTMGTIPPLTTGICALNRGNRKPFLYSIFIEQNLNYRVPCTFRRCRLVTTRIFRSIKRSYVCSLYS